VQLTLYRWLLEEYRGRFVCQQLGNWLPVSDKAPSKQWSSVDG
jgi:hypothetical protein